jgi:hypothetical protein
MIEHKSNGYLATPFNPTELAEGIEYVFNNPILKTNARKFVLLNFTNEIIFNKIMPIYKSAK